MVFGQGMQQTRRMVFVSADFLFLVSVFSNVRDVLQILVVRLSLSHQNHMRLIHSFRITMDPFFSLGSIYAASLTQSSVSHTNSVGGRMNRTNQITQMMTCPSTLCFFQKIVIEEKLVRSKFNQEIVNFHRPTVYAILKMNFLDCFEKLGVVVDQFYPIRHVCSSHLSRSGCSRTMFSAKCGPKFGHRSDPTRFSQVRNLRLAIGRSHPNT